ncbi:MAG TPA: hypothetical protein VGH47_04340 [Xanthobacteraceae bacterium]|jgi:hypothetical protein
MKLRIKPKFAARMVWSRPDSQLPLCSLCYTIIPNDADPLMMFNDEGACAWFCDVCAAEAIEVVT